MAEPLTIAKSGDIDLALLPALANRHGCITGATGTSRMILVQSELRLMSWRFLRCWMLAHLE
jgi:hypothetical protein